VTHQCLQCDKGASRVNLLPVQHSIPVESLNDSLFEMLLEAFEATDPPGWFDGLLTTLEAIDASSASNPPAVGRSSIAGHCAHLQYSLELTNAWLRNESVEVDFSQAWALQHVDDPAWNALKKSITHQYERLLEFTRSQESWSEETLVMNMKSALHVAYHVGAIRQIAALLKA
jgi:hypothetical protein